MTHPITRRAFVRAAAYGAGALGVIGAGLAPMPSRERPTAGPRLTARPRPPSATVEFGVDPAFLDHALAWTFDRVAIDAQRAWIAGFSDGASYALSLGIANGDFFSRVLAFSPGFVIPVDERGRPRFFVSHGRQDPILPIDQCSRRIVPELRHAGYDVRFDEVDGGHRMPPEVLAGAGQWLRA